MCRKISLPNEILLLDELTPSMLDVYVSTQILTKNGRNCHIKVSQIEKLLGNKDNTNHRYIINNLQKLNDLGVIFFEKVGRKISISFAEISKKFTKIEAEDYFAIAKGKSRLLFCYLETLRKNKRIQIAKTGLEKLSCLLRLNFELPAYVIRKQISRHLRRLSAMLSFKIENNVFFFQFTEKSTENDTKPPKINDCSDSSNAENAQKTENLIESWPPSQDVDIQQTPIEITPEIGDYDPHLIPTTKVATSTHSFSENDIDKANDFSEELQNKSQEVAANLQFVKALASVEPKQPSKDYHEKLRIEKEKKDKHFGSYKRLSSKECVQWLQDNGYSSVAINVNHIISVNYNGSKEDFCEFFSTEFMDFMSVKNAKGEIPVDDLVAACLRKKYEQKLYLKRKTKDQKQKEKLQREEELRKQEYNYLQSSFDLDKKEDNIRRNIIDLAREKNLKIEDIFPGEKLTMRQLRGFKGIELVDKARDILGIQEQIYLTIPETNEFFSMLGVS